ncbi:MAG TPA: hypothetical protein VFO67_14115 [Gemmatimonadales bacterium]|nr:hypothetical protein [Gemmatimonadales bacterium]
MALAGEVKAGLATAAATLAVGLLTLNQALVGVFYDDGLYAGLATALASGQGYVHPNLPGLPGAVHYPPLYPAVLAPIFALLPVHGAAIAAKVLNALLGALGAGLIAWHATRIDLLILPEWMRRWLPSAVVFAAAVAIPVLATQTVLFAEPLFAVLLAVAVIATDQRRSGWLIGTTAALALLTRSIGIAIVGGVVCFLLVRPPRAPWRSLVPVLLPPAVAALGWTIWVSAHRGGIDEWLALGYGTYLAHIDQAGLSAIGVNVPDMSRPLEALTFGWIGAGPRWLYVILSMLALGVGLYGLALLTRRSAVGFVLIFYFVILAIWPHPPDRFLWAVLPWLFLGWSAGLIELTRGWPGFRVPAAVFGAVVAGGFVHYEVRGFAGRWWDTQARAISANFAELLPVVTTLPDSAVVATDDEALVWLYSRRQAVPLYLERYHGSEVVRPTPAEHRAYLERMRVTHVLLASSSSPSAIELRGLIGAYPQWLSALYRWPDGRWLFAVNRGP